MLYKKFHIYITAVARRLHMMYVVRVFSNITITNTCNKKKIMLMLLSITKIMLYALCNIY